ncbi:MAG: ABC transporter ATP-binding protein [Fimbriimonadales bacterium]
MKTPFIVLDEVSKIYQRDTVTVYALREVSLNIQRGEFVVILGPSGCGKSTLLNLLGGLDHPTQGRVIVDGDDISHYSDQELTRYRREKIGFVFQFFNLIPSLTARENILLASELVPHPRPVDELLRAVGLEERADHFPGELSGGEQQRIAIARALVTRPALLLCDEPTGELDSETGKRVLNLLRRVNREEGQTVILVTHNTPIAQIADHIIRLRDGQVEEESLQPNPVTVEAIRW